MAIKKVIFIECDYCHRFLNFTNCSEKVAKELAREKGYSVGKTCVCEKCKWKLGE